MADNDMTPASNRVAPWRWLLLAGLLALGLLYVAAFAWLKRNSSDFVARELDQRAVAAALKQPLPGADGWTCHTGSAAADLLAAGWMVPLHDGCWSNAGGAILYLPAAAAGKTIELDFGVAVLNDRPQTLALFVGDQELARWQPTRSTSEFRERVALPAAQDGAPLRLQFRIEREQPWLWHGTPPGDRKYGVKLRRIGLPDDAKAAG